MKVRTQQNFNRKTRETVSVLASCLTVAEDIVNTQ